MNQNQYTDTGFLSVDVKAVLNAQPIENATVSVFAGDQIVEQLRTDRAGQTEVIELGAPPVELSLMPETQIRPYSEYTVRVDASGYEPVYVEGVQILAGRLAIQRVNLRAIPSVPTPQVIIVEPNSLWGNFPPKIPEAEVKPLPTEGGFVVLSEPVIPEFIIVHLGAPQEAAQNVWVPFKDYIANVASCEIYSTWPVETIRANVLAIISFALNRVYTEWYRSRGFDFTITNNTAYDMLFSYGRNIYDSILNVVNDIFTTYVTRPGIRQPLFTQFCDGARVSCAGLLQWGSKTLGDQGLDALSILRNYYGTNVYLTQAQRVQGVPISYPGQPLQVGSTGMDVRIIQTQLNTISNSYPMIPKIRVDGIYGPQTEQAVRIFQQIFRLPETGVVDFATWYEISKIFVSVTRIAEPG
ncbi:MAG: peptidoglycan-binding protein [Eubacteriales bacterium]|jgi:peptidoglycan hydrolase-like protein with peptidoglycan-binding domain